MYIISALEVGNRIEEEDWYAADSQVMGGFRHVGHRLIHFDMDRIS